ncbi:MAG: hypothetical protein CME62_11430 [Halobacteriovoraceae bacterium]|nr:hypothetical protein [Halobacteriovoraceae bacterium]
MNYLSLCIGNFGVVPLFSFAFFLFLPALLSLSFLLVRVFIVLDPIYLSSIKKIIINNERKYLTFTLQVVKIFMLLNSHSFVFATESAQDIFLSKGEQVEINAKHLKSYSIGNKEVLSAKLRQKTNKLLLKGKGIGFSDLIIWTHSTKKTYRIYVHSKRKQLKEMRIFSALKDTQLTVQFKGEWIEINGVIESHKDFQIISTILENKNLKVIPNVELNKEYKNSLIADIYSTLYKQGIKNITCSLVKIRIICKISDPQRVADLERLKQKYNIQFEYEDIFSSSKTFEVEFKIYSFELLSQNSSHSGLNRIEGPLNELVNNQQALLETGNFFFQDQKLKTELIANPRFQIIIGEKFKFSLGQEIPIAQVTQEVANTTWKFSGIKLNGETQNKGDLAVLKIKSQITAPNSQGYIQGPSGETSFHIRPGKFLEVFHVNLSNHMSNEGGVPLLNKIPLLKKLFTHSSESVLSKNIAIFVKITEKINE